MLRNLILVIVLLLGFTPFSQSAASSNEALSLLTKGPIVDIRSFSEESDLEVITNYIQNEDAYQQSLDYEEEENGIRAALHAILSKVKQRHDSQNQLFCLSAGISVSQKYVEQKIANYGNDLSTSFNTVSSLTREFHHFLQIWQQGRFMAGERSSLKQNYVNLVEKIDHQVHFALMTLHNNAFDVLETTRVELLANGTDIFNMNIRLNLLNQKFAFAFSYAWDLLILAIASPGSSYNYLETALENTKLALEQLKFYQDSVIITSLTPFINDIIVKGVAQLNSTIMRSYYYDFQLINNNLLNYDFTGNNSKVVSALSQNFSFAKSASFSLNQPFLTWQQVKSVGSSNVKFIGKQSFTNNIQELSTYNSDSINWLFVHPPTTVVNGTESLNYFSFYHPAAQKYLAPTACLTSSSGLCANLQTLQVEALNMQLFTFNKESNLTYLLNISTENYSFIKFGSNFKLRTKGHLTSSTSFPPQTEVEVDFDRCNSASFILSSTSAYQQDCLRASQWAIRNVRPYVYVLFNRLNGLTLSSVNYSNVILMPLYAAQATNGKYQRSLADGTFINQEWSILQSSPISYSTTPRSTFWTSTQILTQNYSSSNIGLMRSSFDLDLDLFPMSLSFNPAKSKDINQRFFLTPIESTPVNTSFQDEDKTYTIASWNYPGILLTGNLSDKSVRQINSSNSRTQGMNWQIRKTSQGATWRLVNVDWSEGDLYCLQAMSINQVGLFSCDDNLNQQIWNLETDPKYAGMAYQIRNQFYPSSVLSTPDSPLIDGDLYRMVVINNSTLTSDLQTRFMINALSY